MKTRIFTLTVIFISVLILVAGPLVGSQFLTFGSWLHFSTQTPGIFELRLFRTFAAFSAGAGLAAGGLVFQTVFRNDLATPFTLGVSSAAAFGAALSIKTGIWGVTSGALIGGFLDLGGLLALAHFSAFSSGRPAQRVASLVLAGVALSAFFASGVMCLRYLAGPAGLMAMEQWMLGSMQFLETGPVLILTFASLIYYFILRFQVNRLDMLIFSDEWCAGRGFKSERWRYAFMLIVLSYASLCVAMTGPIGFIGLIVPHMLRKFGFRRHRQLLFYSMLSGGIFLTSADILTRLASVWTSGAELPPGLVTVMVGTPFFVAILLKRGT